MIPWFKWFLPIPLTVGVLFIICFFKGQSFAIDFLLGSLSCWLGQIIFFILVIKKINQKKPKEFLTVFFVAEFIKLMLSTLTLVGVVLIMRLAFFPTLLGFIVNLFLFCLVSGLILPEVKK